MTQKEIMNVLRKWPNAGGNNLEKPEDSQAKVLQDPVFMKELSFLLMEWMISNWMNSLCTAFQTEISSKSHTNVMQMNKLLVVGNRPERLGALLYGEYTWYIAVHEIFCKLQP